MSSYAHEGQSISGRFDLVYPIEVQLPYTAASSWIARDTVLSRQLRAIVLDPDNERTPKVLDSARRTALIDNPDLVSIVSVVSDESGHAILTEIPPGRPLSHYLSGERLNPDAVRSIIGKVSATVNLVRHRGVRHLQMRAADIYIQDSGGVVVDGFGTHSALAGADTTRPSAELDHAEARGITVLFAALLLGEDFPTDPSDHDAVINRASDILDLPDVVREVLEQEKNGAGAQSPGDLMRRLAPWPELDPKLLGTPRAAFVETQKFPLVSTDSTEQVAHSLDETQVFGLDSTSHSNTPTTSDSPDKDEDTPAGTTAEAATGTVAATAGLGGLAAMSEPEVGAESSAVHDRDATDATAAASLPDPPPARSREDAAKRIDDALGIKTADALSAQPVWPSLTKPGSTGPVSTAATAPADSALATPSAPRRTSAMAQAESPGTTPVPQRQSAQSASEPAPVIPPTKPVVSRQDAADSAVGAQPQRSDHRYSKIVLSIFAVLVLLAGLWSISRVLRPPEPVEIKTEGGYIPLETEDAGTGEQKQASEDAEPEPATNAEPVIAGIQLVNPDAGLIRGTDPATQDNPSSVGNAVDENPGTFWATWTYTDPLMRPMTGIGLAIELEETALVSEITLSVNGEGGNIQWRDTVQEAPGSGKLVAEGPMSSELTFTAPEPVETDRVILWITEQPTATEDGGYRTEINEITVN